eukprot:c2545_g1_i1 orf=166-360(+)
MNSHIVITLKVTSSFLPSSLPLPAPVASLFDREDGNAMAAFLSKEEGQFHLSWETFKLLLHGFP